MATTQDRTLYLNAHATDHIPHSPSDFDKENPHAHLGRSFTLAVTPVRAPQREPAGFTVQATGPALQARLG